MPRHSVCPWWLGYFLASPLRRLSQNPAAIVAPYVREGMLILEPGPGMGFFTLELARRVGESGRVIAVDLQPKMIASLKRRAARAGLAARVDARVAVPGSLRIDDLTGKVDFTLAFAMVHELPTVEPFFREVACASKRGARLLLAEPSGHVKTEEFESELKAAAECGFIRVECPVIRSNQTALLEKY